MPITTMNYLLLIIAMIWGCSLSAKSQVSDSQTLTNQAGMILIYSLENTETGYKYRWSITKSQLDKLPRWNPAKTPQPPLSNEAAFMAATNYLHSVFPKGLGGKAISVSLRSCGAFATYKSPQLQDIWAYEYYFDFKAQPGFQEQAYRDILVLMDGTVVKPEVKVMKK